MYNSRLAQIINDAVNDCITYGSGTVKSADSGIQVTAEWADNETDIEVTVMERGIVRFTWTEPGVANA